MSRSKITAVLVLAAGLMAGGLHAGQASSVALREAAPRWDAGPDRHQFLSTPDGLRYRGPWLDSKLATDRRHELRRGTIKETAQELLGGLARTADHNLFGGGTDATAAAEDIAAGPPYLLQLGQIGDTNGDGVGDVFSATYADGYVVTVRSGASGEVLWQRSLEGYTILLPAQIAGAQGFLNLEYIIEQRSGLLRDHTDVTLVVTGLNGSGSEVWSRQLKGSELYGQVRVQLTDMPFIEALADVRGDGSDDLVFVFANSTYYRFGVPRDRPIEALGVIDGSDGSLVRGEDLPATRFYRPVSDLDGNGKRELIETRYAAKGTDMVLMDGAGAERWSRPIDAEYLYFHPAAVDLDGDGDRDLLYVAATFSCVIITCAFDEGTYALDGGSGELLAHFDDKFPYALAQVDDDAAVELQLFEPLYDEASSSYGFAVEVFDVHGELTYRTERVQPEPEAPWYGSLYLFDTGDLDADLAWDHAWEFGRYREFEDEDGYWDSEYEVISAGRASGATGSDLGGTPAGWPAYASFDGTGDDYLDVVAPASEPTVSFAAADGLSGTPLWSSSAITVGYDSGGWLLTGDFDGDGGDDLLVAALGALAPGEYRWDGELRFLVVDGATGALRWNQLITS